VRDTAGSAEGDPGAGGEGDPTEFTEDQVLAALHINF
jgi:hypothetical protein